MRQSILQTVKHWNYASKKGKGSIVHLNVSRCFTAWFPLHCFSPPSVIYLGNFLLHTVIHPSVVHKSRPNHVHCTLEKYSFSSWGCVCNIQLFGNNYKGDFLQIWNMNFIRYQRRKWKLEPWTKTPLFTSLSCLDPSCFHSLCIPLFLDFPPQKPHASSRSLIRCSTCSLFVLRPWHVVSFPSSWGQPQCARDNGMKCWSDKPPEDAWRKHRSVSTRVITLHSLVHLSEEQGLWFYRQALPICSPLLQAGMCTLEGIMGVRGALEEYSHICLAQRSSLVKSIATRCAIASKWTGNLKLLCQSLQRC